eukprot:CAMPEP_0198147710 /NCGR_PEP_ID=MMETSP1443-20131203/37384_1 /TAXON_ID=186043 /ORGANISM="Entomoneis sp., Strain CCMP2396" /LENGTH=411 /DNA_ID=CAMNT_0043812153 /DNA_START=40 /DNA_END=1275 /DNA_ORIENTATION=-
MVFPSRKAAATTLYQNKALHLWIRRCAITSIYGLFLLYLWASYHFFVGHEHHQLDHNIGAGVTNSSSSSSSSLSLAEKQGNGNGDDINVTTYKARLRNRFEWGREQTVNGGAFVHIGKTGGSSLSVLLRNGCHSWLEHPCRVVQNETIASQMIESYYHVADFGLLPQSQHDFYLLTLRDPYDRTISSFVYEHYLNVKARGEEVNIKKNIRKDFEKACLTCFPTLESFVALLNGNEFHYPHHKSEIVYDSCQDFARAVFHGRVRIFHHSFFNYRKIQGLIPNIQQQTLLVTRLEYLWHDWDAVNQYLTRDTSNDPRLSTAVSPRTNNTKSKHQHQHQHHIRNTAEYKLPVTRDLSQQGQETLCRALQPEYDSYFWLISRAKNLQKSDLVNSLVKARERCPHVSIDFKAMQQT